MNRDRRLSVALHVLVHLAERPGALRTSEDLARCVGTNPVVIRRTLAGLRDAGFVASVAGPGGGWSLARDASAIRLGEVCAALGARLLFAVDLGAPSGCRVQGAVERALEGYLSDAEAALLERLDRVSIADLAAEGRGGGSHDHASGGDDHDR
jgi:Rrf2 family protein